MMKGPIPADLRRGVLATLVLALAVGGFYPLVVWGVAHGLAGRSANGTLVQGRGAPVGSELLGQPFTGPGWFHPRPSCAGGGYDATASGGSNLGPLSGKLIGEVRERIQAYRTENGLHPDVRVPADAVTASGSGLDPHISPANARLQAGRVALARGLPLPTVMTLVEQHTSGRGLGILGEPAVNVLTLNLALRDLDAEPAR